MPGNPTLNANTFSNVPSVRTGEAMTVQGTVNKTGVLLLLLIAGASYTWRSFLSGGGAGMSAWVMVGAIGGFIVAMITCFKPNLSPITAPIYAILEGLFIGGVSSMFEARAPGIVIQAVMLTFGTLAAMLAAYTLGLIKATAGFRRGVIAATGGLALFYLVSMVLRLFHVEMPFIYGSGLMGIGFSVLVVGLAAMNLIIDFDVIERGASGGAPKYMEWYASFGLLVTLVWLYMEILRLLSKLNRRN